MQIYKSIGDVESGKKMYDFYSDVHDRDEPHFLSLRSIVLERKQPRRMFAQHNTVLQGTEKPTWYYWSACLLIWGWYKLRYMLIWLLYMLWFMYSLLFPQATYASCHSDWNLSGFLCPLFGWWKHSVICVWCFAQA